MITSTKKHTNPEIIDQVQSKFKFDKKLVAVHTCVTQSKFDSAIIVEFDDQTARYQINLNGDKIGSHGRYLDLDQAFNKVSEILN